MPALALLETLGHFPELPYDQLPALQIPDGEVRWTYADRLRDEWIYPTALPLTQSIFSEWLQSSFDLGVSVPSTVMDISYNVLLHPKYRLHQDITILGRSIRADPESTLMERPNLLF